MFLLITTSKNSLLIVFAGLSSKDKKFERSECKLPVSGEMIYYLSSKNFHTDD